MDDACTTESTMNPTPTTSSRLDNLKLRDKIAEQWVRFGISLEALGRILIARFTSLVESKAYNGTTRTYKHLRGMMVYSKN